MYVRHCNQWVLPSLLAIAVVQTPQWCIGQPVGPIEARSYAVTSGHPAATAVGIKVLEDGGNVMDAAVATSLALGVSAPFGSGLGGKLVMLYRDGATGEVTCLEALAAAPANIDAEQFSKLPLHQQRHGYAPVCVPGLPAGLSEAHQRWGLLPWRDVVEPAAELAEQGIPFIDDLTLLFASKASILKRDREAGNLYLVDGVAPEPGEVLRFDDLARTLRLMAEQGTKPFYEGEIAEKIVAAARAGGSSLTMDDFRAYKPRLHKPLVAEFQDHRIYASPPPLTGGVTVLATLKALEAPEWLKPRLPDVERIDHVSRVLFELYPRIDKRIADDASSVRAAGDLLSAKSIAAVRLQAQSYEGSLFADPNSTIPVEPTLDDEEDASTSHLVVADSKGNVACITQSLSFHFGASVVAPGTGVLLNNSMNNFNVVNPRSVNAVAPGKRPRSTMTPVIVEHNQEVRFAFGIPGGQRIPSTTVQLLLGVLASGDDLPDAFERWRFHLRRPIRRGEAANVIDLEEDAPASLVKRLQKRGWNPVDRARDGQYFGGGNGVQYLEGGKLLAVADSRRANAADGR